MRAFEAIVMRVQTGKFVANQQSAFLIYSFVLLGLYFVPHQIGENNGRRDADPEHSQLPFVILFENQEQQLRLLFPKDNALFVAILQKEASNKAAICIVPFSNVKAIVPYSNE